MKLTTIGCIFYFEKTNDDVSAPVQVEVHYAPIESGGSMVAIKVDKQTIYSEGTALPANEINAGGLAWLALNNHT